MKSTLWTGRPLRALATPYIREWELNRRNEIEKLQGQGLIVLDYELDKLAKDGQLTEEIEDLTTQRYVMNVNSFNWSHAESHTGLWAVVPLW